MGQGIIAIKVKGAQGRTYTLNNCIQAPKNNRKYQYSRKMPENDLLSFFSSSPYRNKSISSVPSISSWNSSFLGCKRLSFARDVVVDRLNPTGPTCVMSSFPVALQN